jgi:hypothetical protein
MSDDQTEIVRTLVTATGRLAQFCDRAEHNEAADRAVIIDVSASLRSLAARVLRRHQVSTIAAYADRLASIELRHPIAGSGAFDAADQVPLAKTWRDLQRCQAQHDGTYHPDVNGLSKLDQLRHYTQHLGKLAWYFQDNVADTGIGTDATTTRVTDILVFGVKLATVCGYLLPEEPIDAAII